MPNVFIFHGTEGHPQENWFPWLKEKLEAKNYKVFVPQFPSPPIVPASLEEWFEVLRNYEKYIDEDSVLIGHSLGGIFTLRVLEKLEHLVKAVIFVGTPIGIRPILNYDRDNAFSGFSFNWPSIKSKAKKFIVYQSDNDPYVCPENGERLAKKLKTKLTLISGAGHFNARAGYIQFPDLLERLEEL